MKIVYLRKANNDVDLYGRANIDVDLQKIVNGRGTNIENSMFQKSKVMWTQIQY